MSAPRSGTTVLPEFDFDKGSGFDYHPAIGLYVPKDGGHALVDDENPLPVAQSQGSDFVASDNGRLFSGTSQGQTIISGLVGAFVATTPQVMMRNAASTKRMAIRNLVVSVASVGGGGASIEVNVAIDTADRLSAGGSVVTPQSLNTDSAVASALTGLLESPTATAAGAGTRYVANMTIPKSVGTALILDQQSGIILGTTSSLLLYFRNSAGAASTFFYIITWEEID